jgi:hypothetical protein
MGASKEKDRREHDRSKIETRAWISWSDRQGARAQARGFCLDISEAGVKIETSEPIPPDTSVGVAMPALGIRADALVRYCRSVGSRYVVGLELSEKLPRAARAE